MSYISLPNSPAPNCDMAFSSSSAVFPCSLSVVLPCLAESAKCAALTKLKVGPAENLHKSESWSSCKQGKFWAKLLFLKISPDLAGSRNTSFGPTTF